MILINIVCQKATKYFSRRQKQTTFVVIGATEAGLVNCLFVPSSTVICVQINRTTLWLSF